MRAADDWVDLVKKVELDDAGYRRLAVDGSAYSPSWRALTGGSLVYEMAGKYPDGGAMSEAYEEELDRLTGETFAEAYWEEGCLWIMAV